MLGLYEGYRAWSSYHRRRGKRSANDRRGRHEHIVARRRVGGWIVFPTRAIVQRQVRPNLPFILKIEVVLIKVMLLGIQTDFVAYLERQENVGLQVGNKHLRHRSRQTVEVIDEASQVRRVRGVDS